MSYFEIAVQISVAILFRDFAVSGSLSGGTQFGVCELFNLFVPNMNEKRCQNNFSRILTTKTRVRAFTCNLPPCPGFLIYPSYCECFSIRQTAGSRSTRVIRPMFLYRDSLNIALSETPSSRSRQNNRAIHRSRFNFMIFLL